MGLGREERQKDFGNYIVRNSSSIVFDQHSDIPALLHGIDRYRYPAFVVVQGFNSIDQEVEEELTHQNRTASNHRVINSIEPHLIGAGTQVTKIGKGVGQQRVQIDALHAYSHGTG